jgi:hypothetical protein
MGVELLAPRAELPALPALADELGVLGFPAMIVMVDGALVAPGKQLPDGWRDVRVRTPAGTISLVRRDAGIAVVVWGNADDALREAQRALAAALSR